MYMEEITLGNREIVNFLENAERNKSYISYWYNFYFKTFDMLEGEVSLFRRIYDKIKI